jgi:hypothetical protein
MQLSAERDTLDDSSPRIPRVEYENEKHVARMR